MVLVLLRVVRVLLLLLPAVVGAGDGERGVDLVEAALLLLSLRPSF